MTKRKDPTAPPAEHTLWPKRAIVEVQDQVIGVDPYNLREVKITFDILECGHKKKRGVWNTYGRVTEQSNSNRHCQACYLQGETA